MDGLTLIILIIIVTVVIQICSDDMYIWLLWMCGHDGHDDYDDYDEEEIRKNINNKDVETFGGNGALQSLYSNDGIQDLYLTVNNDNTDWSGWSDYNWGDELSADPYRYWRGLPWYLPTRNLTQVTYYPYLYEYNIDRYGRFYPYW
jgi:hypothetical protein